MTLGAERPLPIGTRTIFGEVSGITFIGERYYFLLNDTGVSLMPAIVVETPVCLKL